MTARVHDYTAIHRAYLADPKLSIRAVCRKFGVKSYSTVAAYAREHGWYEERAKIAERTEDKIIERASDRLAAVEVDALEEFRAEALTVIRAALYKFAEDLKRADSTISPESLLKLINQGLLLFGQPTSRTEERHLELTGSLNTLPGDFLSRLVEATRPGEPRSVGPGTDSPPRPAGTRQN